MEDIRAWVARRDESGIHVALEHVATDFFDPAGVRIQVHWSSLNYKDAMALAGRRGVLRSFPLVPGIDLVGEVAGSDDTRWRPGDVVMLHGAGLGEARHGGLSEVAVVPGDHLLAVPAEFTERQAAGIGTAGLTSALMVAELLSRNLTPRRGPVLVTGPSGGVGSIAVSLLSELGFDVVAATSRPQENHDLLRGLGADEVIDSADLVRDRRDLGPERWAGVVDAVGGEILSAALSTLRHGGVASTCGMAAGGQLAMSVYPFILRGGALLGVDSVRIDLGTRERAWELLRAHLRPEVVDSLTRVVGLEGARAEADTILAGRARGRVAVDVRG